jgi:hypothetical protein
LNDIAWQKAGIFKVRSELQDYISVCPNLASGRRSRVHGKPADRSHGGS